MCGIGRCGMRNAVCAPTPACATWLFSTWPSEKAESDDQFRHSVASQIAAKRRGEHKTAKKKRNMRRDRHRWSRLGSDTEMDPTCAMSMGSLWCPPRRLWLFAAVTLSTAVVTAGFYSILFGDITRILMPLLQTQQQHASLLSPSKPPFPDSPSPFVLALPELPPPWPQLPIASPSLPPLLPPTLPPTPTEPTPTPPPLLPPPSAPHIVDLINARFQLGRPSNDLSEAGVILHVFDESAQQDTPWAPRYHTTAHVSASIIYKDLKKREDRRSVPMPFSDGGLVIRPTATMISCAYPIDASSMVLHPSKRNGWLSGCPDRWCGAKSPGRSCGFAYHHPRSAWRPSDLAAMLEHHKTFGDPWKPPGFHSGYNEIIIQPNVWRDHVPEVIEAFFHLKNCTCQNVHDVAGAHAKFLQHFHLTASQVPLLEFDPYKWDAPFSVADPTKIKVAPTLRGWANPDWGTHRRLVHHTDACDCSRNHAILRCQSDAINHDPQCWATCCNKHRPEMTPMR